MLSISVPQLIKKAPLEEIWFLSLRGCLFSPPVITLVKRVKEKISMLNDKLLLEAY